MPTIFTNRKGLKLAAGFTEADTPLKIQIVEQRQGAIKKVLREGKHALEVPYARAPYRLTGPKN